MLTYFNFWIKKLPVKERWCLSLSLSPKIPAYRYSHQLKDTCMVGSKDKHCLLLNVKIPYFLVIMYISKLTWPHSFSLSVFFLLLLRSNRDRISHVLPTSLVFVHMVHSTLLITENFCNMYICTPIHYLRCGIPLHRPTMKMTCTLISRRCVSCMNHLCMPESHLPPVYIKREHKENTSWSSVRYVVQFIKKKSIGSKNERRKTSTFAIFYTGSRISLKALCG